MSGTVLIVDDEPQLLRLLIRVFERGGFQVLSAENGDDAIDLFTKHVNEIDVLVLDVIIPPKGAAQVIDSVLPKKPELGLVLASGDQLPTELRDRLQSQGGIFVRKPFQPKSLLRTVKGLFDDGPRATE